MKGKTKKEIFHKKRPFCKKRLLCVILFCSIIFFVLGLVGINFFASNTKIITKNIPLNIILTENEELPLFSSSLTNIK